MITVYAENMEKPDLLEFLQQRMSMTDVYQPVVIKELLLHDGRRTKAELAAALAAYDIAVQDYFERIVMRWPKITLTKHGIIDYERRGSLFRLVPYPQNPDERLEAVHVCDRQIGNWLEKKKSRGRAPEASASIRYEILKEARGKCQLCGISAEIRPIDIDHIVPRSKADKNGKVRLSGRLIDVNDRGNLQALCFACNRAKRASDETDFRRRNKLVRDLIPELIAAEGREPVVKQLKGRALRGALYDKLAEEHAEFLSAKEPSSKLEELVDLVEVVVALAAHYGCDEAELMKHVARKRADRGGFSGGYFYQSDA